MSSYILDDTFYIYNPQEPQECFHSTKGQFVVH